MKKILLLSSFIILCFGCKKKTITASITEMQLPIGYPFYSIIQSVDSSIVAAGGNNYFVGSIFVKNKSSSNWQPIIMPNGSAKLQCLATRNNMIWAGGLGGFLVTGFTNNLNWSTTNTARFESINAIVPLQNDLFFLEGLGSHGIYQYDAGFNLIAENRYLKRITNISFCNESIGYASVDGGILKTIDGGKTYNYTKAKNDVFTDIFCFSPNNFIACGLGGGVYLSKDGGATLQTIKSQKHLQPLNKIAYHKASNKCLVVGDGGQVFQVDMANSTCTALQSFTHENIFGVCAGFDHQFLLCGDHGKVWTCDGL